MRSVGVSFNRANRRGVMSIENSGKLIQEELQASKEFYFDLCDDGLPRLTRRNVALAEAMIANNSSYRQKDAREGDASGRVSAEIWLSRMREVLIDGTDVSSYEYRRIVKGVVTEIDRENSTHLNADKGGIGFFERGSANSATRSCSTALGTSRDQNSNCSNALRRRRRQRGVRAGTRRLLRSSAITHAWRFSRASPPKIIIRYTTAW